MPPQRHWNDIESVLNIRLYQEEGIRISTYEAAGAFEPDKAALLMEISAQATGESQLETMLRNIENIWKETELSIVNHHDQKDVFVLAGTEELQVILDDSTVNINTIAASKFVGPIQTKVLEWIELMELFNEMLGKIC